MIPNQEFTRVGIPQRYHRRLERGGITTVAELVLKTATEISLFWHVGPKAVKDIQAALAVQGYTLAGPPVLQKPSCRCSDGAEMFLLMANRRAELWGCQRCARLLLRSIATPVRVWYQVAIDSATGVSEIRSMNCPKCKALSLKQPQLYYRTSEGAWLCLTCEIRGLGLGK